MMQKYNLTAKLVRQRDLPEFRSDNDEAEEDAKETVRRDRNIATEGTSELRLAMDDKEQRAVVQRVSSQRAALLVGAEEPQVTAEQRVMKEKS